MSTPAPRASRAPLAEAARVAAFGAVIYGAARFAGAYLAQFAFAGAVVQMVIAEWGAGRIGITWSDPAAPAPTAKDIAKRAARGVGMGLTAALVALGVALGTRAASLAPNAPSVVVALVGALVPACLAARDELLLRGLVLRVAGERAPRAAQLAACGVASAAAAYGDGSVGGAALVAAGLGGAAYGALWLADRGAWLPWGAHAAFAWASGALAKGGLLDLRAAASASPAWSGGDLGVASGWCGALAALLACAGAIALLTLARARPRATAPGADARSGEPPR